MPPAVTVVGSLNLDVTVEVARLPGRGETVVGTRTTTGPGGKGANQASAAAALAAGYPRIGGIAMVGRVGDDDAGRISTGDLTARGVDVSGIQVTPGVTTGTATVAVEPGGENLIVVAPGANAALTVDDVLIGAVREAAVLLAGLEVPLETVTAAARAANGLVVVNPAPPPIAGLPPPLLAAVDVLVPNEWELRQLGGAPPAEGPAPLGRLTEQARSLGIPVVVVTIGSRGALVVPRDGEPTHVPAPAVATVDSAGAGDCFCGALAVALSAGSPLVEAVRFAVEAAARSTTVPGARVARTAHRPGTCV
ncbi:MAG: PfkB family carbohydrate kinase [Frankia sp.]